jgi:HK97 gp10 family phage protein
MFTVEVKGLRELQAKFQKLPQTLKAQANGMIQDAAEQFVGRAKSDAPIDVGFLSKTITYFPKPVTNLSVEVVASSEYAPYMEWGTITKVNVPNVPIGLPAYAITFKGKGIRKTGGIIPHPFFFKQLPIAKAQLEADFKLLLKDEKL